MTMDTHPIEITPEILREYKKHVGPFFKEQKANLAKLNSESWVMRQLVEVVCWRISVDTEEARGFLGRAFQDEEALHEAAHAIIEGHDMASIDYLRMVMARLEPDTIRKKDIGHLTAALKATPHPEFEGVATPWIEEHFPDHDRFRRGAACSLIAQLLLTTTDGPVHRHHHHHHHKHRQH